MRFLIPVAGALALFAAPMLRAQSQASSQVDFEMMTWVEVKNALAAGKTTALIYNGGTEQRGPQNVNGGHTLMGHATAIAIAQKLGNAIVAPTMPFSPNNASADLPGTIGLTPEIFAAVNERVAEQMIKSGFKKVVLMGDHGGGQKELGEVAKKLDEKYSSQGIHVVFCDEVYEKANGDFDKWLTENGYPLSTHAGIPDTSEMLYLGGDKGWVRKDQIATALGDPVRPRGAGRGQQVANGGEAAAANADGGGGRARGQRDPNRVNNGIQGDARRSTVELGKKIFDMKVDYAVREIHQLLNTSKPAAAR